jgi:hypothetical protein
MRRATDIGRMQDIIGKLEDRPGAGMGIRDYEVADKAANDKRLADQKIADDKMLQQQESWLAQAAAMKAQFLAADFARDEAEVKRQADNRAKLIDLAAERTRREEQEATRIADEAMREQERQVANLAQTYTELGMAGANAMLDIAKGSATAKEAAISLMDTLVQMALQAGITAGANALAGGWGGAAAAAAGTAGAQSYNHRAASGPTGMGPTVVGERGPEIFWPGRSGYVEPNDRAARRSSRGRGGSVIGSHNKTNISVTVPEGTSPQDAEAIANAIDRKMVQTIDRRLVTHAKAARG